MIIKRGGKYAVSVYDPSLKRKRWAIEEFSECWLTQYARPATATQLNYLYGLRRFRAEFGHARMSDLDRLTARTWALAEPQSNVRAVRAMFNDAINDGLHPGPNL